MPSVHALQTPSSGPGSERSKLRALLTQIERDPLAVGAAEEALERILDQRNADLRRLTEAEMSALERMGVGGEALSHSTHLSATQESALAGRRSALRTYTAAEVALLLGVSTTRVRQRAADRSLLAQRRSSGWHFPVFQFPASREPAGWATVARAIPADVPLLLVERALTAPQSMLVVEGAEQSVFAWLAHGGDPGTAATAVVDDLTRLQ